MGYSPMAQMRSKIVGGLAAMVIAGGFGASMVAAPQQASADADNILTSRISSFMEPVSLEKDITHPLLYGVEITELTDEQKQDLRDNLTIELSWDKTAGDDGYAEYAQTEYTNSTVVIHMRAAINYKGTSGIEYLPGQLSFQLEDLRGMMLSTLASSSYNASIPQGDIFQYKIQSAAVTALDVKGVRVTTYNNSTITYSNAVTVDTPFQEFIDIAYTIKADAGYAGAYTVNDYKNSYRTSMSGVVDSNEIKLHYIRPSNQATPTITHVGALTDVAPIAQELPEGKSVNDYVFMQFDVNGNTNLDSILNEIYLMLPEDVIASSFYYCDDWASSTNNNFSHMYPNRSELSRIAPGEYMCSSYHLGRHVPHDITFYIAIPKDPYVVQDKVFNIAAKVAFSETTRVGNNPVEYNVISQTTANKEVIADNFEFDYQGSLLSFYNVEVKGNGASNTLSWNEALSETGATWYSTGYFLSLYNKDSYWLDYVDDIRSWAYKADTSYNYNFDLIDPANTVCKSMTIYTSGILTNQAAPSWESLEAEFYAPDDNGNYTIKLTDEQYELSKGTATFKVDYPSIMARFKCSGNVNYSITTNYNTTASKSDQIPSNIWSVPRMDFYNEPGVSIAGGTISSSSSNAGLKTIVENYDQEHFASAQARRSNSATVKYSVPSISVNTYTRQTVDTDKNNVIIHTTSAGSFFSYYTEIPRGETIAYLETTSTLSPFIKSVLISDENQKPIFTIDEAIAKTKDIYGNDINMNDYLSYVTGVDENGQIYIKCVLDLTEHPVQCNTSKLKIELNPGIADLCIPKEDYFLYDLPNYGSDNILVMNGKLVTNNGDEYTGTYTRRYTYPAVGRTSETGEFQHVYSNDDQYMSRETHYVLPGSGYTYRLKLGTGAGIDNHIVMFSNLEQAYGGSVHWQGEFIGENVDAVAYAASRTNYLPADYKIKIYYSASSNTAHDLASGDWVDKDTFLASHTLKDVKSIAIDFGEYRLPASTTLYAELKFGAPSPQTKAKLFALDESNDDANATAKMGTKTYNDFTVSYDAWDEHEVNFAGTPEHYDKCPANICSVMLGRPSGDIKLDTRWEDNDNTPGKRPDSYNVKVYQRVAGSSGPEGEWTIYQEETLSSSSNQPYASIIEDVPIFYDDNGTYYEYKIVPDETNLYTTTFNEAPVSDENGDYNFTITKAYNPYHPLSFTKTTNDDLGLGGAQFTLYYTRIDYDTGTLTTSLTPNSGNPEPEVLIQVETWSSEADAAHETTLLPGEYVLKETSAPAGFEAADPIRFTVGFDGTITMDGGAVDNGTIGVEDPYKLIDIPITVIWDDADNQDGFRPDDITEVLTADGTDAENAELSGSTNTWTTTIEDVHSHTPDGAISYNIKSNSVDEYERVVTGNATDGFAIVYTHTPEKVSRSVEKVWIGGISRPDISIQLYADKAASGNPVTLSAGNWSHTWNDLPKYAAGKEIVYAISEASVPGYTVGTPEYDADTGKYTITNTANTMKIDEINSGTRLPVSGHSLEIRDEQNEQVESWSTDGAPHTVSEIIAGKTYKLYETERPDNFEPVPVATIVVDANGNASISGEQTSTKDGVLLLEARELIDVEGSKTWDDDDNRDGVRPASITVNLYKNTGTDPFDTKVVNAVEGNVWSYKFENLYKYDGTTLNTYSVEESVPADYSVSYDGYAIKNTHVPATIAKTVSKVWDDNENQDGKRPDSITVQLKANGANCGEPVVLSETDNKWTYTWTGLFVNDKGSKIDYTVEETVPTEAQAFYTGKVTDDGDGDCFIIENTHPTEKKSVSGVKTWTDDNNNDRIRPAQVTIALLKNGSEFKTTTTNADAGWQYSFANLDRYDNGAEIAYTVEEKDLPNGYTSRVAGNNIENIHANETVSRTVNKSWVGGGDHENDTVSVQLYADEVAYGSPIILSAGTDWTYTWNGLQKYNDGVEISYTVVETPIAGYKTSTVYDAAKSAFTVTNTASVVQIEKVNAATNAPVPGTRLVLVHGDEIVADWVTEDAPKVIEGLNYNDTYTLRELLTVSGYEPAPEATIKIDADGNATIEGPLVGTRGDVLQIKGHEIRDVSGTKTWNIPADYKGAKPAVTVKLLRNGDLVDTTPLANDAYSFKNLRKYDDEGIAYTYSVEELVDIPASSVPDWKMETNKYDFVNTYAPETATIDGTVLWVDENDHDGIRPNGTVIILIVDDKEIARVDVSDGTDWKFSFDDLPVRDENGNAIDYRIAEVDSDGYATEINGYDVVNTHIPEYVAISVNKFWDDEGDVDGLRPAKLEMKIFANGEDTGRTVELSAANDWSETITDLDKYEYGSLGKQIKWTVEEIVDETVASAYKSTTEVAETEGAVTMNVTNTHVPNTTSVVAEKKWEGDESDSSARPVSIKVVLQGSDGAEKAGEITAANKWKATFAGLPANADGAPITWTMQEIAVDGYESKVGDPVVADDGTTSITVTNTRIQPQPQAGGVASLLKAVADTAQETIVATGDKGIIFVPILLIGVSAVVIVARRRKMER